MDVSEGHSFSVDPKAFLEGVYPQIHQKLVEEVLALNGIKFQLAFKIQLRKDNPDGSEEYTDLVLRHKQEAILQIDEIERALNEAIPHILELLENYSSLINGPIVLDYIVASYVRL